MKNKKLIQKIGYYPGCSLESTAKEYDLSFKAVSSKVGLELVELPDWNCCGASSAHAVDELLEVALPARVLMIAEEMDLDVTAPCAACFLRLMNSKKKMDENPDLKKEVEDVLGKKYTGTANIYHPLTLFSQEEIKKRIQKEVTNPLDDLKVVCYYGCYLVRPPKTTQFDDPENPTVMDEIIKLTGAEVLDWSWKTDCCGGSHALMRPDIVEQLIGDIGDGAQKTGANGVVTACPLCQSNLEVSQKKKDQLQVFYFTELLGISMGLKKEAKKWLKRHLIKTKVKL